MFVSGGYDMIIDLERRINQFYSLKEIFRPTDISLYVWDDVVPIRIIHRNGSTQAYTIKNIRYVFLDRSKPLPYRRAEIAHEIGHALLHCGNQLQIDATWRLKQEWQANQFAFAALTPAHMVYPLIHAGDHCDRLSYELAETFCVPVDFMASRLDDLCSRVEMMCIDRVAEKIEDYVFMG